MDEAPRPEVRIGDRERRATDTHLQQAHADGVLTLSEYDERAAQCWAARTRSDLDALVRDLPPYRPGPDEEPTVAVAAPEDTSTEPAKSAGKRIGESVVGLAAVGALLFVGANVITAGDGAAIFGSRQITVAPGQERVEVGMLFGSIDVVVPEGVRARPTGAVIFGSTDCALACTGPGSEVVVDATGAFGSVDILRPGEPEPDDDEDEDDD